MTTAPSTVVPSARRELLNGNSASSTTEARDPAQEERDFVNISKRVDNLAASMDKGREMVEANSQKADQVQAGLKQEKRNIRGIQNVNSCLCQILLVCALIAIVVSLVLVYRKPVLLT